VVFGDAVSGGGHVVVGLYALPPILASATTDSRSTTLVAVYSLALAAFSSIAFGALTTDDAVRTAAVGVAGALSVWGAMRREKMTAAARGAAVLGELTERYNQLEQEETAEGIVRAAVPELANIAIIDLLQEDGAIAAAAVAGGDARIAEIVKRARGKVLIDPGGAIPVAEVIRSGERQVHRRMGDADHQRMAADAGHLAMLREVAPRSMLIVPLKERGLTYGALTLGSLDNDDRYGAGEIAFAVELARRAGVAIANARLHERQARLTEILQTSLLPRAMPQIDGFEIAVAFRPAMRAEGTIGGDFYDIFRGTESGWKAVIGDVCGKGPEAAALTALTRDTLRAAVLRGDSPCESLELLNAAILEASRDGRFCTCAVVGVEVGASTRITVCNGGHPPPLILRRDGTVDSVGEPGTLLGIYEDPDLVDADFELRSGDLLFLYTDGLFEIPLRPGSEEVHVERLLAECAGLSAAETAKRVENRVLELHHGDPGDDLAILALLKS
jgi:hypothetical protein